MRKKSLVEFSDAELITIGNALMREYTWTVETANKNGYDWSDNVEQVRRLWAVVDTEFVLRVQEEKRIEGVLDSIAEHYRNYAANNNFPSW